MLTEVIKYTLAIFGLIPCSYVVGRTDPDNLTAYICLLSFLLLTLAHGLGQALITILIVSINLLLLRILQCVPTKKPTEKSEEKSYSKVKSQADEKTEIEPRSTKALYPAFYSHQRPQIFIFVNVLISYIYRLTYKAYYNIPDEFDLVGSIFVMIIKTTYAAGYFNGSYRDVLEYLLFTPGVLVGPVTSYKEYLIWKEMRRQEVKNLKEKKTKKEDKGIKNDITISTPESNEDIVIVKQISGNPLFTKALRYFCTSYGCLLFHLTMRYSNFVKMIMESDFIMTKAFYAHCMLWGYRSSIYYVWFSASTGYALLGMDVSNVSIYNVEFASCIRNLSQKWNICTHNFFKEFIFKPLRRLLGNKSISAVLVYVISALMHSYRYCDLVCLIMMGFGGGFIDPAMKAIPVICDHINIRIVITTFYMSFVGLAKLFEDFNECLKIWKNMKYYGLVLLGVVSGLGLMSRRVKHKLA